MVTELGRVPNSAMQIIYDIPNYYSRLSYGICRIPATLLLFHLSAKTTQPIVTGIFMLNIQFIHS
jgi:hypothetical protein